jgi:hypothetical protein
MTKSKNQTDKKPTSKPEPNPQPESREPQVEEFMEIGGSPVPGITLRCILRGNMGWYTESCVKVRKWVSLAVVTKTRRI